MEEVSLNRRMSDKHEEHLAERLGGRQAPGSGNQWARPMDVRQSRFAADYAFAVEGKSTLGKSIGVSRDMIAKAREQARGERPMLALRFYDNERLDVAEDWVAIPLDDFEELREHAIDGILLSRVCAIIDNVSQYDSDTRELALAERLRALIETGEDPLGVV